MSSGTFLRASVRGNGVRREAGIEYSPRRREELKRSEVDFDETSNRVIGAAMKVHRALGPGLLESAYARCLELELKAYGRRVRREIAVPVIFRGIRISPAYRLDLLVDERVIVEVKAVAHLDPIHKAQLLTYLRLTGKSVGLILNFNVPVLRDGIVRMVR
jgi:GxxExxY protein